MYADFGVAIGRREGFDAVTGREAISAQNIDFLDVATDKNSGESSEGVADDSATNFDDVEGDERDDEIIDRGDETGEAGDETTCSTDC